MADISKIKLPDGTTYNIKDPNATDTKVTQTSDSTTNSDFPILFAGTADNTTRTEGAKKSARIVYNPYSSFLRFKGSNGISYTDISTGQIALSATSGETGETNICTLITPNAITLGNHDSEDPYLVLYATSGGGVVLADRVNCNTASIGEVEFPHTYSDEEQVVGYWVDGSPIYEKTVELSSALTLASNTWVSMGIYNETIRPLHVIGYNATSAGYAVVTCLLAQYIFSNKRLQLLNARSSASQITGYTIRYIKEETT